MWYGVCIAWTMFDALASAKARLRGEPVLAFANLFQSVSTFFIFAFVMRRWRRGLVSQLTSFSGRGALLAVKAVVSSGSFFLGRGVCDACVQTLALTAAEALGTQLVFNWVGWIQRYRVWWVVSAALAIIT